MNRNRWIKFYDADEGLPAGAGGGDGEQASTSTADVFAPEGGQPQGDAGTGTGTSGSGTALTQPKVEPTPQLTAAAIAQAVKEGLTPAQPNKEYTQAELDKMFKVWVPTEELITRVQAGGADAVKAFMEIRDGLAAQFGQLSTYQLEVLKKELVAQIDPAVSFVSEARAEKEREQFYKDNEDLRDHANIVDIAYKSLIGEGKTFPTIVEARKGLADRAKQLLPNLNGNGTAATQPSGGGTQTTTTQTNRPAFLSKGSQAGGGGGTSAPANPFHEIFGAK